MTPTEIEAWLWEARAETTRAVDGGDTWWPRTQGQASGWAAAFFVKAARARIPTSRGLSLCMTGQGEDSHRRKIIAPLWATEGGKHWAHEILVDLSVYDWSSGSPILFTAESEVGPNHGVLNSLTTDDDYSWDFFKLLVVPSPIRLFFARVGAPKVGTAPVRIGTLTKTLSDLVALYSKAFLRAGDELGAVIIPAAKADAQSGQTTILWWEKEGLHSAKALEVPRMWKGTGKTTRGV